MVFGSIENIMLVLNSSRAPSIIKYCIEWFSSLPENTPTGLHQLDYGHLPAEVLEIQCSSEISTSWKINKGVVQIHALLSGVERIEFIKTMRPQNNSIDSNKNMDAVEMITQSLIYRSHELCMIFPDEMYQCFSGDADQTRYKKIQISIPLQRFQ